MYCDFQVISYYKNLLRNTFINLQRSSSSNPITTITTNLSEPHLPTSNIFPFPNPTTITKASWNHIYQFPTFFLSQTHRRKLQNSLRITFSNFQHCSKKHHKPNKDNYEGFSCKCNNENYKKPLGTTSASFNHFSCSKSNNDNHESLSESYYTNFEYFSSRKHSCSCKPNNDAPPIHQSVFKSD